MNPNHKSNVEGMDPRQSAYSNARIIAGNINEHMIAAYWRADQGAKEYFEGLAHEEFVKLAKVMGYEITPMKSEDAA